jgi:hypothetical protein
MSSNRATHVLLVAQQTVGGGRPVYAPEVLDILRRAFRRERVSAPHPGPQGEEYDALQMEREWQDERGRFAENVIKKVGHKNLPFLDDPFD